MKVEIADLKRRYVDEKNEILRCVKNVLKSGNLILSDRNKSFEKSICKLTKAKYCLGLNSGTDALMMALWSVGIKKGDEVITSPISFIATSNSIIHVGAKPVFVDVDDDLNIDPKLIEKAITKKTKAILPVHWTGRTCKMDQIKKIAKKHNLLIIEDAAQAIGAYYKNIHAGTFGKISAFSVHPYKNLNALGDGGFIITNEKILYDKIKAYRNHGIAGNNNIEFAGVNSRLDSVHAEVLNYRLKKLRNIISTKRKNINLYKKLINSDCIKIIDEKKYEKNSHSMFVTLCDNRDSLQKYLQKFGIETRVYYKTPLHLYEANKFLGFKKGSFPKAENLSDKFLSFPYHQYLSMNEIKYVCNKVNNFYRS